MAASELNTQFLSLYLYTPNAGFPGINNPFFFTTDQTQNPKKSNYVYIKSGVYWGNNLYTPLSG